MEKKKLSVENHPLNNKNICRSCGRILSGVTMCGCPGSQEYSRKMSRIRKNDRVKLSQTKPKKNFTKE